MKASTRIEAEGKLREVEGALQDAVGAAAKDRDRRLKGKTRKEGSRVQGAQPKAVRRNPQRPG